ncbi:MAG TPA: GAF and ANTAR domain-containing protein [Jatrophihabitans sp.]|jgi:hypothetical protein|nr:GAF and ANTAR domain-containing protein [Jatrophihabitans sp.]
MARDGADVGKVNSSGAAASLVARICRLVVESLPVSKAAVSVMTAGGHRGVVSATDETAQLLEDVQFTVGEGPGCDAFECGRAVLVADLEAATPAWSAFRDLARDLAVQAVFAFPLHLGAARLGTLTAFHGEPGALSGEHLARAVRLSDAAAVAVLDLIVGAAASDGTGAGPDGSDLVAEFYRAEIYQAAGMVMEQLGVSIEVATVRLRTHAYVSGRPIGDIARDVVARTLRLEADGDRSLDQA